MPPTEKEVPFSMIVGGAAPTLQLAICKCPTLSVFEVNNLSQRRQTRHIPSAILSL